MNTTEMTATTVRSADGTTIAAYRTGAGPAIVLIDPALSTHKGSAKLAAALAEHFSVVSYDRRGRGGSGDEHPESADPDREVDDISALIDTAGGRAILFGTSPGPRSLCTPLPGWATGSPGWSPTSRRTSAMIRGRRWPRIWRRASRHPSRRVIDRGRPGRSSSRRSACRASAWP